MEVLSIVNASVPKEKFLRLKSLWRKVGHYRYWRDGILIGLVAVIALSVVSMLTPAPYNMRYLFNRLFFAPKFVCRDDVYSFAATSQGACSGHGGIKRHIPKISDDY